MDADIGIVGAGPAGARLAELLATSGAGVVLLDDRAPWEKPCGGGLTPPAFQAMPELTDLRSRARRIDRVRIHLEGDDRMTVPLDEALWMVSRRTLAAWQLDRAVSAGARHLSLRVREIRRAGEGWALDTDDGELHVPFLVGADGAASLVRRAVVPDFRVELEPTRVAYPQGSGSTPEEVVLWFWAGLAGYLWDFPRSDHRSVGIVVPERTWRRPRLDGAIDDYRARTDDTPDDDVARRGAVIGTAALGHGDYTAVGGPDYALLGDAAGFADPLTGEGIQNALRSARLLARAWTRGEPEAYPGMARQTFESEFRASRFLRRHLLEGPKGVGLLRKALSSRPWYGLATALLNAVNEGDPRPFALLGRWARAARRPLSPERSSRAAR